MAAARLVANVEEAGTVPAAVTVGIAADVDVEIARDAWASATAGTVLEGVPVAWEVRRSVLACLACGNEYAGEKLDRCPVCGGDGLVVDEPPVAEVLSWSPATP